MGKNKLQSSTKSLIAGGIASLSTAIGLGVAGYESYVAEGGNPIIGLVAAAGSLVASTIVCLIARAVYLKCEKAEDVNKQSKAEEAVVVEEASVVEK